MLYHHTMYKNATFAAPLRTRDRSYSFANKSRLYLSPTQFKNTSQLLTQQTRDPRYSYSHPPFIRDLKIQDGREDDGAPKDG